MLLKKQTKRINHLTGEILWLGRVSSMFGCEDICTYYHKNCKVYQSACVSIFNKLAAKNCLKYRYIPRDAIKEKTNK